MARYRIVLVPEDDSGPDVIGWIFLVVGIVAFVAFR